MNSKSKAIKSFLAGISHQIPEHALSHLLKDGNKALKILLQKSIEALPMGSPIRTSVDGDLEKCVEIMKVEVEKRISEQKLKEDVDAGVSEEGVQFLPVVNEDIFLYNLDLAMKEGDDETLKAIQCMDFASLDMIVQNKESTEVVMKKFSSLIVSGQFKGQDLNSFITLFANRFSGSNDASLATKIKDIRAFIRMFQVASTSSTCEDIGSDSAIDLGKLVGCLVSISILDPESYLEAMKRSSYDDSSDNDSSDEDIDDRPTKRRKITTSEMKQMQQECKADALLCLSLILANFSQSRCLRVTAGSFAIGYVNTILLDYEEVSDIIMGEKIPTEDQEAKLAREGSSYLIEALELSNCMDRRDLPSASLISDGKKRSHLLKSWAEKIVVSAAATNNSIRKIMKNNEGEVHIMDTDPKESETSEEEDILVVETTNSEDDISNKDVEVEDSHDDNSARRLFVMDTQPEETIEESHETSKDDNSADTKVKTKKSPSRSQKSPKVAKKNDPSNTIQKANEVDNMDANDTEVKSSERPRKIKKSARKAKKGVSTLSSVPENEEAKEKMSSTINASPSTNAIPRDGSTSSVGTPSRSTRTRNSTPSILESVGGEVSDATSTKRTTRTRSASNASDTEGTPLRKSRQPTSVTEEASEDAPTPRRSARKRN